MSKESRDKKLEQLLKAPLDVEDKRSPEQKYSDYLVANYNK
jgi:hypothetical protein